MTLSPIYIGILYPAIGSQLNLLDTPFKTPTLVICIPDHQKIFLVADIGDDGEFGFDLRFDIQNCSSRREEALISLKLRVTLTEAVQH